MLAHSGRTIIYLYVLYLTMIYFLHNIYAIHSLKISRNTNIIFVLYFPHSQLYNKQIGGVCPLFANIFVLSLSVELKMLSRSKNKVGATIENARKTSALKQTTVIHDDHSITILVLVDASTRGNLDRVVVKLNECFAIQHQATVYQLMTRLRQTLTIGQTT